MDNSLNKNVKMDVTTTLILLLLFLIYVITRFEVPGQINVVVRIIFSVFIIFMFLLLFLYKQIPKNQIFFLLVLLFFQLLYIFNIQSSFNIDTLFIIIHHLIFFMLLYITTNIKWEKENIIIFNILVLIIYLFLIHYIFIRQEIINTNTIGGYAYLLSFFPLLYVIGYSRKLKLRIILFILIASGSIIFFSGTRSIFFAAFFSLLTFILWKLISSRKILFYMYFFVIIFMVFVTTFLYPKIKMLDNFEKYNYLSIKYTGKTLLSGRHTLWESLINIIEKQPLLGYGSGVLPNDFIKTDLTSHNLYLQILLQVGLIGVLLLFLILFLIWKIFFLQANNSKVMLVGCYFVGIITYQIFEVTLTQNNFGLGIIQWLIIGIGLSYVFNRHPESNYADG